MQEQTNMDETDNIDLSRREFVKLGTTTLASIGTTGSVAAQQLTQDDNEFQQLVELEGPRSARPDKDDAFFQNHIYYAYRYIDEVTKASWYTTQDLDTWHPEPVGAADQTTGDGEQNASIVTRDGDLYVRRYQ